jgi:hypothetical protein
MCRYALTPYKQHYACFACRKSFKRKLKRDVDPEGEDHLAVCPQCGKPTAEMGLDFKPPPQQRKKDWELVQSLWTLGETFHSCGCGGPGYRPRSQPEYRAFLQERLREYEETLKRWIDGPRDQAGRDRAITEWRARVKRLQLAISQPSPPRKRGR